MNRDTHTAICDRRIWRPQTALVATIATVTSAVNIAIAWATPSSAGTVAPVGGTHRRHPHHIGWGAFSFTGAPLVLSGIVLLVIGVAALLWMGRRGRNPQPRHARLD